MADAPDPSPPKRSTRTVDGKGADRRKGGSRAETRPSSGRKARREIPEAGATSGNPSDAGNAQPDGATPLAVTALVCGIAALATFWVFPVSWMFGLAAIVCGAVALSRGADAGATAMSIIGIVVGALVLVFTLFLFAILFDDDGGSSFTVNDNSGSGNGNDGGGSGDDGSNDEGGSSGDGDEGGSSGGGTDEESPMPVAALAFLGLLGAAAAERRLK